MKKTILDSRSSIMCGSNNGQEEYYFGNKASPTAIQGVFAMSELGSGSQVKMPIQASTE